MERAAPDVVVMAAGLPGYPVSGDGPRAAYLHLILAMQFALFRALQRSGSPARIVLIGGSTVYGAGLPRDPPAPMHPQNFRGVAKAVERLLAERLAAEQGRALQELRVFCAYGRWMARERLLTRLLRAALEGGRVLVSTAPLPRDWIHHDDIARAVLCTQALPSDGGPRVINLCSGTLVDHHDVIRRIEKLCGRTLVAAEPFPGGDRMGQVLSGIPPPPGDLPGWSRRVDLDTGLVDLWRWATTSEGRRYLLEERDGC